jgi:DNA-binding PadR family transcriptional regulator
MFALPEPGVKRHVESKLTEVATSLTIVSMGNKARDEMPHLAKTEATILDILLGEGSREMYGLEIVNGSNGRITRGSVYVVLSRMGDKGLVESRPEPAPTQVGGLPRVLYKASGLGLRAYRAWVAAKDAWGLGVPEGAR